MLFEMKVGQFTAVFERTLTDPVSITVAGDSGPLPPGPWGSERP